MGYPMTWRRMRMRNRLWGTYGHSMATTTADREDWHGLMAGELQRIEDDSTDDRHLAMYAALAGITEQQAALLLRALFNLPEPECGACHDLAERNPWRDVIPATEHHRCAFHEPQTQARRTAEAQ